MTASAIKKRIRNNARRLQRLQRLQTETENLSRSAGPRPFGRKWARKFLPRYFSAEPADFHAELFDRLRDLHTRRDSKEAIIAPREGAKSTVVTLAYVLWCVVEAAEPFVLILSDSAGQAQDQLAHVRRELEDNPDLAEAYPHATGIGRTWRNDKVETRNGTVIMAIGTGGRIRGRRSRQARPSLIIFDDVENPDSITSAVMRARAWRWATRDVIPAGTAGTNYLSVGSALHRECVAVRLGQLAGWTGHVYRAIHHWPDNMKLWAEWERKATNLADPDRAATALRFYEANRPAMDAGAVVYWPSHWPLYALMKRRAEIGPSAFDTEYQGIPSVEGLTEWPAEFFDRPGLMFDEWPKDLVIRVQSLDPSKGSQSRSGDYQAHILAGLGRDGCIWVEAVLNREPIGLMVTRALDLSKVSGFGTIHALAIETNDSLGMLVPEFDEQTRLRNWLVPIQSIYNDEKSDCQNPPPGSVLRPVSSSVPQYARHTVATRPAPRLPQW